ncbi:MAG: hypothetical protein K6B52_09020 [Clostridiales bacterium]|nr:hypothetical protein [Clostridiales bacterium]
MKILFQGDSITDAGRNREDCHDMGSGYPSFAAEFIKENDPDIEFEFVNLGISGDQTKDLVERIEKDFVEVNPDILVIHIGINDTWHRAETKEWLDNETFEKNYREVLEAVRYRTYAKIVMVEQFLLPVEDKEFFREDLNGKIDITRKLARRFADCYIPLDGLMAMACVNNKPEHWSDDGVHPNKNGSEFIGRLVADAVNEMIAKGVVE